MMSFSAKLKVLKGVRKICGLLLLAVWPVVTSHALLQNLGLIHEKHNDHLGHYGSHEHKPDNHHFADGDYTPAHGTKAPSKPDKSQVFVAMAVPARDEILAEARGEPPKKHILPAEAFFIGRCWQFESRAALPARAPSRV